MSSTDETFGLSDVIQGQIRIETWGAEDIEEKEEKSVIKT